jgi:hypothetical protein
MCGKVGHQESDCRGFVCICGKLIVNRKRDHSVKDAAHDKARKDYVPFSQRSSKPSGKPGDRDLSRNNPRNNQPAGEKKLANQLKANDKANANMTKYLQEGQRLVEQNKLLRTAIESSQDTSLSKSVQALVPYVKSSVFQTSSSKSSKKRKADEDSEPE